jgi:predicted nucleic acid-binding protein
MEAIVDLEDREALHAVLGKRDLPDEVADATELCARRQNGIRTLCTRDTGFRRFTFLRVVDPFQG